MSLTYHQCLKAIWKGKRFHINATGSPFQKDEAHFLEVAYFDELVEDGEVTPSKPQGTPMPDWEDLDEGKTRIDNFAFTSTGLPRKGKSKPGNKGSRQDSDCPRKVQLTNRRTSYLL